MFIWTQEIKEIVDTKVTFIDGTEKEYTTTQLQYIATEESKDASALQEITIMNIADQILEVLKANNVRKGDMNQLINLIVHSFEMMFQVAIGKAFWTYDAGRHPTSCEEDIRMSDFSKFN